MQDWETQGQGVLKTLQPLHSVMQEIMPPWDDCRAFLASFEQVAKACQWPTEEWAARLFPALSGEAEEAFRGLEAQDREDYGKVKAAILRADALRMETQRQHFRDFSCQEIEDPRRLQNQVQELCHQWLRPERRSKEQILELLILEQFLASLPPDLQGWIRAGGPDTCSQAVALVEDFLMSQQVSAKVMRQGPLKEEGLDFSAAEEESLRAAKEELYRKSEQNSGGEIALRGSGFRSPGGRSPLLPPEGQESIPSDVKTEPVDLKEASHSLGIVKQNLSKPGQQTIIWQVLQENEAKTSSLGDVKGREVKMETSQYGGNEPEGIAISQGCVLGTAQMFEENGKYTVDQPLRRENGNYETRDGLLAAIHQPSEIQNLHEMPFLRESERKYQHTLEHDMVHTNQDHGECAMTEEDFQKNVYSDKHQRMVEGEARSEFTMEGQRDIFNKQLSDHKEEIPNRPSEFGDSFEYTKPFKKNKGVENEGGLYECPHCRKCFRCEEELMDHQQLHTGEERQDHVDSGQVVPFTEMLIRGQGIHPPVRPYVCCQCGKSFNQRRHLENHQRTHTGVKPYTCSQCGKCFNQRRYLKIHQRIHTGEKPYKCSECGKKFIRGQCLKNHQRTHAGDKPYACSQCGKCFNQIRYLKTHQRIHAELKPYKCLQCGRSFTQRGALINHQKIHTRRNCINDLSVEIGLK